MYVYPVVPPRVKPYLYVSDAESVSEESVN